MGTTKKRLTKGTATSTARERSERHHRRHDPGAAREALKDLWPNPAIRRAAATLIANSIKVAHAEAPSSWEVTLHPECLRLNVGQIAVLDLYDDEARIYAVRGARPGGAGSYKLRYGQYDAVDAKSECWACDLSDVDRLAKRFVRQHHALIRIAANAKRVSPFKKSHSPGAVTALTSFARTELPTPDYAISESPDDDWTDNDATPSRAARAGAGWASRPSKEVEEAAVRIVTARFKADGWRVRSVEDEFRGYDLHCERRGKSLHVEVKGSAGPPARFIMTRNELRRAEQDARFELYLVGHATTEEPVIRRWRGRALLDEHVVEPTQFELRPVASGEAP